MCFSQSNRDARQRRVCFLVGSLVFMLTGGSLLAQARQAAPSSTQPGKVFRAGASTSVITPKLGVSMQGSLQDRKATHVHDELHARCIVLDDGTTRLAIAVMDNCMLPLDVAEAAKKRAHELTKIPVENMMLSATHTHSSPTTGPVFQSEADPDYLRFLSERIADAIQVACNNLVPAKIGWGVGSEPNQVFNRRWMMKPGSVTNPFGGKTDQATMNPGFANPDRLKPAGPTDPEVPVVALQSLDGRPIGILANYSLHYVGGTRSGDISADYYGMFADRLEKMVGSDEAFPPLVAIMSNGTSGDVNNANSGVKPTPLPPYAKMRQVANALAAEAYKVYQNIQYQAWVPLGSQQTQIRLGVRKPTPEDLTRARGVVSRARGPTMVTMEEAYARETLLIVDYPDQVPVILQAFRIGDLAITAIPCEVFVEIGLELKKRSPFKTTFNHELANGYNGYLPTPEQHALGGYETWRARSAYLEVGAAPKITETLLELLNKLK